MHPQSFRGYASGSERAVSVGLPTTLVTGIPLHAGMLGQVGELGHSSGPKSTQRRSGTPLTHLGTTQPPYTTHECFRSPYNPSGSVHERAGLGNVKPNKIVKMHHQPQRELNLSQYMHHQDKSRLYRQCIPWHPKDSQYEFSNNSNHVDSDRIRKGTDVRTTVGSICVATSCIFYSY